jgi:hypothetical protein
VLQVTEDFVPPTDLMMREQAIKEFNVTLSQLRHLARRGFIHNYRRGHLRAIWVSRSEVEQALKVYLVSPDEDDDDGDEDE